MDAGTLIAIILAVLGVAITIVIWIASTRAVKLQEAGGSPSAYLRSVDEEAYERARKIYEGAIDQLEREVVRLNGQVREFQVEMVQLNTEVIRLRSKGRRELDDSGPLPKVD